jgi:hypothetical protein
VRKAGRDANLMMDASAQLPTLSRSTSYLFIGAPTQLPVKYAAKRLYGDVKIVAKGK